MAVLNSLTSASGQRTYEHAIREFVAWYCSEPRFAFNRTVVLRYRIHLEQRHYAPATINLRVAAVRRIAWRSTASSSVLLCRGALDVRRPRTLRAVVNLELDSITLAQICDTLAIDSALVKEIFLPRLTLDEPKTFVHSQRPNYPHHLSISDLWFLTIAVEFNSTDGMTCLS
jgi:hypothetical protein